MRTQHVLITGSSGLIGSEAVVFFERLGWQVHGVDNNMRRQFFGPDGDIEYRVEGSATAADITYVNSTGATVQVLGSAVPHKYDLILGSHSVHTTPAALRDAQVHLSAIRTRLVQEGRL